MRNQYTCTMDYVERTGPKAGDTVVVGMSGGVDSTMVALLLARRGCHVIGATMTLWDGTPQDADVARAPHGRRHDSCFGPEERQDVEECRRFCAEHDIEYHVIDLSARYRAAVLDHYVSEYRAGRTPNPCVLCNRFVKFGALRDAIAGLDIGYDFFCTGHYARVVRPTGPLPGVRLRDDASRPFMIASAADPTKDQSYFLHRLTSPMLERVFFPLGGMTKREVVAEARAIGLAAAERPESQDFVAPERRDSLFAGEPSRPGDFVDVAGHVLGRHRGVEHYTIGQRRGLGVCSGEPLYVSSIDAERNVIVLAGADGLLADALVADDLVWPAGAEPQDEFRAMAKVRLATPPASATIRPHAAKAGETFVGDAYDVVFDEPQRAVAPGQSVVFYDGDVIVGGGIIRSTR